jgi:hypothetical protein
MIFRHDETVPVAMPATGPVEGHLLPSDDADSGTFHFNDSNLCGAAAGATWRLRLWLVHQATGNEHPSAVREFIGCASGDPNCDSPPCASEETPPEYCETELAIALPAPVQYQVGIDEGIKQLFRSAAHATAQKMPELPRMTLTYSIQDSTPVRAVWSANPAPDRWALRLEVKRGKCGCYIATLYVLSIADTVAPPIRWRSNRFVLQQGGSLKGIDANGREREGAVSIRPVSQKHSMEKETI